MILVSGCVDHKDRSSLIHVIGNSVLCEWHSIVVKK